MRGGYWFVRFVDGDWLTASGGAGDRASVLDGIRRVWPGARVAQVEFVGDAEVV